MVKKKTSKRNIKRIRASKVKTKEIKRYRKVRTSKKRVSIEELFENTPRRGIRTYVPTLLIGLIFVVFLILIGSSDSPTGFAVVDENKEEFITETISGEFKVVNLEKDENSALNIDIKSDLTASIFVEIDDCSYWEDGADRDNSVMYAVPDVKEAKLKVGDVSLKTRQQIDLYKTTKLCLIFVNREPDKQGQLIIKTEQVDKDLWNIIY